MTPPDGPNAQVTPLGQQDPGKVGQQEYPTGQLAELQLCRSNKRATPPDP